MTQTKLASPVPYQRGSTLESTTLYKGGLFSFLVKGEDSGGRDATIRHLMAMGTPATSMVPTEAILHGRGVANDDEFIDPGDSIRVGAANGIRRSPPTQLPTSNCRWRSAKFRKSNKGTYYEI